MPGPKASEQERQTQILEAAHVVAARKGLAGLSTRAVAEEAGLSQGLVFFHFKSREILLVALLDHLLMQIMRVDAPPTGGLPALDQLLGLLRSEIARLPSERVNVELFFDYWVLGTRQPLIRDRIRDALERYRDGFHPLADATVREVPDRFPGVTADGLAAVVVSFIEGCAVQAVIAPDRFDVEQYMATAEALVGRLRVG